MAKNAFKKFGVMIDCSRNGVLNLNGFKKMVDILSTLGYNTIRLYTEDTYEVDDEPYFGYLRGRYTKAEMKEMDEYAKQKGIELIPCIQTLAHLGTIFRYVEYGKIRDLDDIVLVGDERTYKLIDNMFKTLSECFSTKNIHIGMDEAFMLGKGRYLENNGLQDRAEIIKKHLDKVLELANKYGYKCEIWGDMYMHSAYGGNYTFDKDESERVRKLVPENLKLCYWDYYHSEVSHYEDCIDRHRKLTDNVSFGGGIWTWVGFCPNIRYSLEICQASIKACINKGVEEVYFTMWGDNGGECSPFSVLPALVAASEYAKGNFDKENVKRVFKELIGMDYDLFESLEKPDTVYAKEGKTDTLCPTKTMLFTDPFCGIFDTLVKEGVAPKYYSELAKVLKVGEDNEQWGYLFKYMRTLSEVMEVKFDLGVKTRKAYLNGDKEQLQHIVLNDYPCLLQRIQDFYLAFEECWMKEKKSLGFEVQDIRIGGLIQRTKRCLATLLKYIDGKIEKIEELEEEILPPFGLENSDIGYNFYGVLPTANVL